MGTRGLMGVRINGEDKLTYNHFDGYPSGLGADIVADLKKVKLNELKKLAKKLVLVTEDVKPTPEQIKTLKQFADTDVSTKELTEWYVLLRNLQGKLLETLAAGVMIDAHDFIKDSLFCEWAYIVNLDNNTFEVYQGFQTKPHKKGRYSSLPKAENKGTDNKYYPCALVAKYPLRKIPKNWVQKVDKEEE